MTAGTIVIRTTNASIRTPKASANPTLLIVGSPPRMKHYAEFEEIIARAVAVRYAFDEDVDGYPRLLAACAMTTVRVALALWYARGESASLAEVVTELFDGLGNGLRTDTSGTSDR